MSSANITTILGLGLILFRLQDASGTAIIPAETIFRKSLLFSLFASESAGAEIDEILMVRISKRVLSYFKSDLPLLFDPVTKW